MTTYNTKPVGVAYTDPYLDGAYLTNCTFVDNTFISSGSTYDNIVIGANGGTAGFFGTSPTTKATALTTQLTTITCSAPGTADYAIQDLTATGGYGFVTADEGQSVLKVIANLQTRVAQLETKFKAYGLLA